MGVSDGIIKLGLVVAVVVCGDVVVVVGFFGVGESEGNILFIDGVMENSSVVGILLEGTRLLLIVGGCCVTFVGVVEEGTVVDDNDGDDEYSVGLLL